MDTLTSLLSDAFNVVKEFRDVGLLAGLMLLVNFLVNATKLEFVAKWLGNVKPVRALVALGLGVLGGVVVALSQGKTLGELGVMALAGGLAGVTGSGFHEVVQNLKDVFGTSSAKTNKPKTKK